ncbi:MAG: hypothetical protein IKP82_00915 [Oscillospiraceae bacterium]|nr:hypothetical protein [Oscillospiraceae bacterium]
MLKRSAFWQILIFLLFLGAFFVLHLALPDRSFSERENRSLQTAPRFTLSALFAGKFTTAAERYVNDQFPLRDDWITLKAAAELASGKSENNGVWLCAGDTLLECFTAPEPETLRAQIAHVNALSARAGVPVTLALVPSSAELWGELLPDGAPNDSQKDVIAAAYAAADCETLDLCAALEAHRDEAVFYRTDHHWTTLGAYYGYAALGPALGYTPLPLSDYSPHVASERFYGTAWSSSGFSWVKPDLLITYVNQGDARITNYSQGAAEVGALYVERFLEQRDKYSYFYGGNTPRLVVETGEAGERLLILRDSFMDSLSPFLYPHFSQLHILDLRYFREDLYDYIREQDIDRVLVCYSVHNFVEDTNLQTLAR